MTRVRADALLLVASLIWGTAFVAQKAANASMGPIAFVGWRFLFSCIVIAPLMLRERLKARPLALPDLALAGLIGLLLFAGSSLQQVGLVTTTATNGGFLTSIYVVFVPPIVWATTGAPPRKIIWVAAAISMTGAWLLTEKGQAQRWSAGDGYVLAADLAWASAISLIPIFLQRTRRPFFLAFAQYAVVALLGISGGAIFEPFSSEAVATTLPSILYAGVVSGGVAYTLQIVAQSQTPAAEAALILSLESVFAAASGVWFLSERLTSAALLGCALILLGAVLVEIGPARRGARD